MKQSGQIMLAVLLVLAVSLTVGLVTSRQTTIDTKISGDDEHLKQAFNTAESGVNYYLNSGNLNYQAPGDGGVAEVVTRQVISDGSTMIDFEEFTPAKASTYFWFVGHNADGTLNDADPNNYSGGAAFVCLNNGFVGSIKLDYFYRTPLAYGVKRWGYNLNYNVGSTIANFSNLDAADDSCTAGKKAIPITIDMTTPLLLAVTPIYNGASVALKFDTAIPIKFPSQGVAISSTGKMSEVSRTIKVARKWVVPNFLLDNIRADGDITSTLGGGGVGN